MEKLECKHCNHRWYGRNPNVKPKTCANCRSKYWDVDSPPKPGPRRRDGENNK